MSLLILFNSEEIILPDFSPSVLPDLHIRDSLTGNHIPVSGLSGSDGDYIQTVALQHSPLKMYRATENPVSGNGSSAWLWTRRKKLFLVSLAFSSPTASADIHVVIEDRDGQSFLLSRHTVQAVDMESNGRYLAQLLVVETLGANKMKVVVESVSEGDVEIWLGAV